MQHKHLHDFLSEKMKFKVWQVFATEDITYMIHWGGFHKSLTARREHQVVSF